MNAGKWCKTSQTVCFWKLPAQRCVCSALYVPIDKIKEQPDESGANQGSEEEKRMRYVFSELQAD